MGSNMAYCSFMDKELWDIIELSSHPRDHRGEFVEAVHGSDVHVVGTFDHQGEPIWQCLNCSLVIPIEKDAAFARTVATSEMQSLGLSHGTIVTSRREMVAHLKKHVFIRELVPKVAFDRLNAEIETEEPL